MTVAATVHQLNLDSKDFKAFLLFQFGKLGDGIKLEDFLLDYIGANGMSDHLMKVMGDMSGKKPFDLKYKIGDDVKIYNKNGQFDTRGIIKDVNKMRKAPYKFKFSSIERWEEELDLNLRTAKQNGDKVLVKPV